MVDMFVLLPAFTKPISSQQSQKGAKEIFKHNFQILTVGWLNMNCCHMKHTQLVTLAWQLSYLWTRADHNEPLIKVSVDEIREQFDSGTSNAHLLIVYRWRSKFYLSPSLSWQIKK